MSKVVVITTDKRLRDITLPLSRARLEAVETNGGMCAEEEASVCAWCLDISVAGMPCEMPMETMRAVADGTERTSSTQDRILAEWVLRVWAIVETARSRA